MQYSGKEYEFLGKQVAQGRYIARSTCALALILAFLVGVAAGRYVFPNADGSSSENLAERKRPLSEKSAAEAAASANKQLFASILQHEEDLRNDPKNADTWEHLGNLYFDAGEAAKAVNAYGRALELKPDNANVMVDCGVMYRELRQYDKALEFFNKALAVNPRHEFALFNSGIVLYHDLNRKGEAVESWRALVKINPDAKAPTGELVSDMIRRAEAP
jgi:cytochrome c-type biogenesis protein CcmH/NrfG